MVSLKLKIVTPEKVIFEGEAGEVSAPSAEGTLGILPHHANLMARLIPGELRVKSGNATEVLAVGSGFMQMVSNTLTILTDLAENEQEIDENAVEEAKKRAETALEQKLSSEEYAETIAVLQKSLAQLKVKRRYRLR